MELVGKNEKIQILVERLDRIEIDANDLQRYYNVEESKKNDIVKYIQQQIDEHDRILESKYTELDGLDDHYQQLKDALDKTRKIEFKKFANDLKELQLRRGKINQEFHRYNEELMAKRKLQSRLESLYKTFENDRNKYRTMIDDKQRNYVTQSIYNERAVQDNIKQLYGRFSKETRLAVENVRQNQTLLNMRLRKKLPKVSHHTRKTLAQCQKLSDKKDKVEIENSIHLDSLLMNDYRMGDSLKQFMERKEVLVLGTIHELEDRNKLKKKQIHDLKNLYYRKSYGVVTTRRKLNTAAHIDEQLNELARKLNDQSRQIDRLKRMRDVVKVENDTLDERLDATASARLNLEDMARQIVAAGTNKTALHPHVLEGIFRDCKSELSTHIESKFLNIH